MTMAKFVPASFNQARVLEGLHKAMGFGEPVDGDDKPVFHIPAAVDTGPAPADDGDVPFDPSVRVQRLVRDVQVPCAYDMASAGAVAETFGKRAQTSIEICIVGPDWEQVKDFTHVTIGGDRYLRSKTNILALGSIPVAIVTVISEDER